MLGLFSDMAAKLFTGAINPCGDPDLNRQKQLAMDLAQRAELLGQLCQGGLTRKLDGNRCVLEPLPSSAAVFFS